ncbi:MAG: AAA family ATPase, partial [Candidatus Firestonebacteria bacterium]|nr:AAA family ATPase [Candidatus Firestonebacteria bacterium]
MSSYNNTARIKSLTLKNFKSIKEETYEFTDFDLLIGRNNSGKSSILQALAIWQYCIDEFRRSKRSGKSAIQFVLPNFTPMPLPKFALLWYQQTDRKNVKTDKGNKPELFFIEIDVIWNVKNKDNEFIEKHFGVTLRYHSHQSIYAGPCEGWDTFKEIEKENLFPNILYVPPFSGFEASEQRKDISVVKMQVGKFQPGSVARNILLRVFSEKADSASPTEKNKSRWDKLNQIIKDLFSIDLLNPQYREGQDTLITCEHMQSEDKKKYDLISGGTGFHQTLLLLSSIYAFNPNVVL